MNDHGNRAGYWRENPGKDESYTSFCPRPLAVNPPVALDEEMIVLLRRLHTGAGYLNGLCRGMGAIERFTPMFVRLEALYSSQLEGDRTTLNGLLVPRRDSPLPSDAVASIDNVNAHFFALEAISQNKSKAPGLSMDLLRAAHKVLLTHSRGRDKSPGEFRGTQNWIGPTGCTLKTAAYVPPNVEDMDKALSDLETFIHTDTPNIDPFVKAALIHYQFETIHPFLDGNGRIGRLLILLYLIQAGVLTSPLLYISYFLKINRRAYYDHMMDVREKGRYEAWVKFFLRASDAAVTDTIASVKKLCAQHEENTQRIIDAVSRQSTRERWLRFLNYLEQYPIVEIKHTAEQLDISFPTASKLVSSFVDFGILKETSGHKRGRTFAYEAYLSILRKDNVPF